VKIFDVVPGSPAALAGLLSGDIITRVDQQTIDGTESVQSAISQRLDQPTTLVVQRDGQDITVTLVPRSNPPQGQGAIGISMGNPLRQVGVIQAIPMGFVSVAQQGQQLLAFPVKLITGQIAPSEGRLVGLKGMFDIYQVVSTTETSSDIPPYVNILGFIATISISFGVINLLPIPALDGGRILFVLPELITGKRIPPKYENVINMVSFALLIMLMIFVNIQDFIHPISLP
jgi:regulator of sigma E protease